ncbi:MAG: hypothetical protein QM758_26500 [Armatimonas sp.]
MTYSTSRKARAQKAGQLTRLQVNVLYLILLGCGMTPLLTLLAPAPAWLLTLLNAPAALICFYLGITASSVLGKTLCLVWALSAGSWIRQTRSPAVLASLAAAHCLALGGLARILVR